jgi:hypothetical protein
MCAILTPQKKCRTKMMSWRGATWGALYSSLKGRLTPWASNTSRSPTRSRSFSVGRSLLTSTDPSKSSCSFCRIGVWLEGEKGGVGSPRASSDVLTWGSAFGADSEGCGEAGRASTVGCADVVAVGGAAAMAAGFVSEVSMLGASVQNGRAGATRAEISQALSVAGIKCAGARGRVVCRSLEGGGATPQVRAEN